jgi:lipoyl(octanoyl) transferase
VTMHGFAFNATTNLDQFSLIVPCGITEYGVTSLEKLHGEAPTVQALAASVEPIFAARFDADLTRADEAETQTLFSLPQAEGSL